MNNPLYEGSHREFFEAFLKLVDDSDAQLNAILDSSSWKDVRSILSIGGGQGIIEASLLRNAPHALIWYLDPSNEQCTAFRKYMRDEDLFSRVEDITQTTFQDFTTNRTFDRIVSVFSWFYIGTDKRWLTKLLDLLTPSGFAILVLPNKESIETVFYRALSPDKRMTLDGDEVVKAMSELRCTVNQDTYTKWLSNEEIYEGEQLSDGSLAFAAFAAERSFDTFNSDEKAKVAELLKKSKKAQGVPLSWDLILVTRNP